MKVLILGNGFDIAHGLPTQYKDFLNFAKRALAIYSFQPHANVSEYEALQLKDWPCSKLTQSAIDQFKVKLKAAFEARKVTTTPISGSLITRNTIVEVDERLDKFHAYLEKNIWYNYFSEMHRLKRIRGENWIDFESEISSIIQVIDRKHTSLTQKVSDLHRGLAEGTDEELKARIDEFTKAYGKIYGGVVGGTVDSLGNVGDQRTRLYRDLERLILALEIYLVDFVEPISVNPLSVIQKIKPDYVISFNYTRTYERLYLEPLGRSFNDVCHIHGVCRTLQEIQERKRDYNIVLGIDEYLSTVEEQTQHTDFSIFKKFVQRIRNNNTKYTSWMRGIEQEAEEAKKQRKDIYYEPNVFIFGHSLDVTDKDILQRFIASEFTRVHVYAHSKPTEGELISHLLRYISEDTVIGKTSMERPMLEFEVVKNGKPETNAAAMSESETEAEA